MKVTSTLDNHQASPTRYVSHKYGYQQNNSSSSYIQDLKVGRNYRSPYLIRGFGQSEQLPSAVNSASQIHSPSIRLSTTTATDESIDLSSKIALLAEPSSHKEENSFEIRFNGTRSTREEDRKSYEYERGKTTQQTTTLYLDPKEMQAVIKRLQGENARLQDENSWKTSLIEELQKSADVTRKNYIRLSALTSNLRLGPAENASKNETVRRQPYINIQESFVYDDSPEGRNELETLISQVSLKGSVIESDASRTRLQEVATELQNQRKSCKLEKITEISKDHGLIIFVCPHCSGECFVKEKDIGFIPKPLNADSIELSRPLGDIIGVNDEEIDLGKARDKFSKENRKFCTYIHYIPSKFNSLALRRALAKSTDLWPDHPVNKLSQYVKNNQVETKILTTKPIHETKERVPSIATSRPTDQLAMDQAASKEIRATEEIMIFGLNRQIDRVIHVEHDRFESQRQKETSTIKDQGDLTPKSDHQSTIGSSSCHLLNLEDTKAIALASENYISSYNSLGPFTPKQQMTDRRVSFSELETMKTTLHHTIEELKAANQSKDATNATLGEQIKQLKAQLDNKESSKELLTREVENLRKQLQEQQQQQPSKLQVEADTQTTNECFPSLEFNTPVKSRKFYEPNYARSSVRRRTQFDDQERCSFDPADFEDPRVTALRERLKTMIDKLKESGLEECSLVLGLDCTESNIYTGKKSFGNRHLHEISTRHLNFYEQVMGTVGSIVNPFSKSGRFPVYFFGDDQTRDKAVRPLYVDRYDCEDCYSVEHAIAEYRKEIERTVLSGPTSFRPLIEKAVQICKKKKEFTLLMIVGDGGVTDMEETISAIVKASNYPLIIVMVGVGDGDVKQFPSDPWLGMKKLTAEIPDRVFKNFHFVQFEKDMLPEELAEKTLAGLPDAYKFCVENNMIEKLYSLEEDIQEERRGGLITPGRLSNRYSRLTQTPKSAKKSKEWISSSGKKSEGIIKQKSLMSKFRGAALDESKDLEEDQAAGKDTLHGETPRASVNNDGKAVQRRSWKASTLKKVAV